MSTTAKETLSDDDGNIVRSLDINAKKAYDYEYEEGKNSVARYTYDAWGVCTTLNPGGTSNTSSAFIGNINPYRYRSYYYDTETQLYYLQSRYYDASIGRFINGDDIIYAILPFGILQHNLFSYCGNNPINNVDYDGCWWFSISIVVAGFVIDALVTWVLPYIVTAFKAARLLKWAKLSKWFSSKYNSAVKKLAKAIYDGMDNIMYKIMGKAANAATRSFTLSKIQRWVENILNFSIGYGIAWIIDHIDGDGKSGYIRF